MSDVSLTIQIAEADGPEDRSHPVCSRNKDHNKAYVSFLCDSSAPPSLFCATPGCGSRRNLTDDEMLQVIENLQYPIEAIKSSHFKRAIEAAGKCGDCHRRIGRESERESIALYGKSLCQYCRGVCLEKKLGDRLETQIWPTVASWWGL